MDHPQLRRIPVGDRRLPALLDKIGDHLRRFFYGGFLFRKIGTQCVMAQGQNDTFFCHCIYLASAVFQKSGKIRRFFGIKKYY